MRRRTVDGYKRGAKSRGLTFNLTEEELNSYFKDNCLYCDRPPSNVAKVQKCHGEFVYSGLDRVDNALGYSTDNVVPCCAECNYQKGIKDVLDLLDWVERVAPRVVEIRERLTALRKPTQASPARERTR